MVFPGDTKGYGIIVEETGNGGVRLWGVNLIKEIRPGLHWYLRHLEPFVEEE